MIDSPREGAEISKLQTSVIPAIFSTFLGLHSQKSLSDIAIDYGPHRQLLARPKYRERAAR